MRREKRERQTEREKERETHMERERESERERQTHCPKAHPKSRKGQGGRVPCTRFFSIKISLQLPGFRKNVFMHGFSLRPKNRARTWFSQRKPVHTFFVIVWEFLNKGPTRGLVEGMGGSGVCGCASKCTHTSINVTVLSSPTLLLEKLITCKIESLPNAPASNCVEARV